MKKSKTALKLIFVAMLILPLIMFLIRYRRSAYTAEWSIVTVDSERYTNGSTPLAVDGSGNYLVTYHDNVSNFLYFAKSTNRGVDWSVGTVDSSEPTGRYPSLAIDTYGNYLISYYSSDFHLKFAISSNGGTDWTISTIDSADGVGIYTAITTDLLNNYLVAYRDQANQELKFAKSINGGLDWSISTVDTLDNVGFLGDIAVDATNNYIIAYYDDTSKDLKFAKSTNGGTDWLTSIVDATGAVGRNASLTIDDSGSYLISYHYGTGNNLKFAKSIDGGENWTLSNIDTVGDVGLYGCLTVDASQNYLVSYFDSTNKKLKFAQSSNRGIDWDLSIIDSVDSMNGSSWIAADAYGSYLIAYHDFTTGDLKFAKLVNDTTAPAIELAAVSPDPGNDTTPDITGTVTDVLGTVTSVEYQMETKSESWLPCSSTDLAFDESSESFICSVLPALTEGQHTVFLRASDSYGNTTSDENASSDTFTVDTAAPIDSFISIENGAVYVTGTSATLSLSATDTTSSVTEMILSEDVSFAGSTWEPYALSRVFTLSSGDGTKTVYAQFRDGAGNTGEVVSDTIILDSTTVIEGFSIGGIPNIQPGGRIETVQDRPTFSGVVEPYATLVITIGTISGTVQANEEGEWSWIPGVDIPPGEHDLSIVIRDLAGNEQVVHYLLVELNGLAETGIPVFRYVVLAVSVLVLFKGEEMVRKRWMGKGNGTAKCRGFMQY